MQDAGCDIEWEVAPISATAPKLVMEIENRLIEEEWLIKTWSPVHLRNLLESYYFKNGVKSVSALKVWQDACQYLYMPRLINDQVLRSTIEEAIKSTDFFGFAVGERDDHYEGFAFGRSATVYLDESCLLIAKDEALNYQQHLDAERKAAEQAKDEKPDHRTGSGSSDSGGTEQPKKTGQKDSDEEPMAKAMSHFYGSLALDPLKAKMQFATVIDEVVELFSSQLGVDVAISVEIRARNGNGFDANTQRSVKENCSLLKFNNAEFEDA